MDSESRAAWEFGGLGLSLIGGGKKGPCSPPVKAAAIHCDGAEWTNKEAASCCHTIPSLFPPIPGLGQGDSSGGRGAALSIRHKLLSLSSVHLSYSSSAGPEGATLSQQAAMPRLSKQITGFWVQKNEGTIVACAPLARYHCGHHATH